MIFGIIPCRMGSSRFYSKPLARIGGVLMAEMIYRNMVDCPWLDGVVVATEDWQINSRLSWDLPVVMTGRAECGSDRCYLAAKQLGLKSGIVINIQGDEPLVNHSHIKAVVDKFDPGVKVVQLVYKSDGPGDRDDVKVQVHGGKVYNYTRINGCTPDYYVATGVMGFRLGVLADFYRLGPSERERTEGIELLRCLDGGIDVHCAVGEPTIAVDRPEDIDKVEAALNGRL